MERQTSTKISENSTRGNHVQKWSARPSSSAHSLLTLQRSIGNRAVQRLINSPRIQAKLQVSTPGDRFEKEADRVADTVMRMPLPHGDRPTIGVQPQISRIQRKCAECENESMQRQAAEEESDEMLQGADGQLQASEGAQSQIRNMGAGQPMSPSLRAYFEPRFGQDFGGVRLHTGGAGERAAQSVNAKAFTLGSNVAFAAGQYSPETSDGKRLLAHELTHVVQQGGTKGQVQRVDHVADAGFRYKPAASSRTDFLKNGL